MGVASKSKRGRDSNSDIRGIVYLVFGFLLFMAIYTNAAGVLSVLFQTVGYRLCGVTIFFMPLYVVYFGLLNLFSKKPDVSSERVLFGTILFCIGITLIISVVNIERLEVLDFTSVLSSVLETGKFVLHGGLFGHVFAYCFVIAIGSLVTYMLGGLFLILGFLFSFNLTIPDIYNTLFNRRFFIEEKDTKRKLFNNVEDELAIERKKKISYSDFGPTNSSSFIVEPYFEKPRDNNNVIDIENFTSTRQSGEISNSYFDIKLLNQNLKRNLTHDDKQELLRSAIKLEKTLANFNIKVNVINFTKGPSITRFDLQPSAGVKVSKIDSLKDDIALGLAATSIRIEVPVPGKSVVGVEVPNSKKTFVYLRDILESSEFINSKAKLAIVLGKNIVGNCIVADLTKMPHLLIAGATGAGKSVYINTVILSLLYRYSPDEVKLILIDPKVVELSVYNDLPNLYKPVITDAELATETLEWAVDEMNRRYDVFSKYKSKNIESYNKHIESDSSKKKMPYLVIIIDELADLMMSSDKETEAYICRLAQKARAAGMHLIIGTQRPSADVITGLIKANIPSRIAFAVSSGIDSRIILDEQGAENLLGQGDMLFAPVGESKPIRIQSAFVSEEEIDKVVEFIQNKNR